MTDLDVALAAAPKESREAADFFLAQGGIVNPGLLFDRFLPRADKIKKDDGAKHQALAAIILVNNQRTHRGLLSAWNERWLKMVESAGAQIFERSTAAPLIVGLGRKGAFEIGFSFHRYGFPYILGSALKGMARTWGFFAVLSSADNLDLEALPEEAVPKRLEALEKQLTEPDEKKFENLLRAGWPSAAHTIIRCFRRIFGTQQAAGQAVFFEAIPRADGQNRPELAMDILNPHYPEYTTGKKLPTNWQDPQPTKFLTVGQREVFKFAIGWRGEPDLEAHSKAVEWLQCALAQIGAGAKTSAGYGVFSDTAPKEAQPVQPHAGPFVDEIVSGTVYDDSDSDGFWISVEGFSTEENGFLAWLPDDQSTNNLKVGDPVTAQVLPYTKRMSRTTIRRIA